MKVLKKWQIESNKNKQKLKAKEASPSNGKDTTDQHALFFQEKMAYAQGRMQALDNCAGLKESTLYPIARWRLAMFSERVSADTANDNDNVAQLTQ